MPLPNTSPDMSPMPTTVSGSVSAFMPSTLAWRRVLSHAPRAVIPIALWSYPVRPPEANASPEPVAVLDGDVVGDVAERRRALVGGDDEVGVVFVVDHGVGRVDGGGAVGSGHQVVGEVEQAADEGLIAADDLRPKGLGVGRRTLDDETALRARRHDDGVLHHLRLHQPEDLRAEVLAPIAPAQSATGDRTATKVDPFDPGPADPHLVARPRRRQLGDLVRVELERHRGPAAVVVRPDRRLDERLEHPADAILVEARDRVERRRQRVRSAPRRGTRDRWRRDRTGRGTGRRGRRRDAGGRGACPRRTTD